jgi:YD repeat-containing protein
MAVTEAQKTRFFQYSNGLRYKVKGADGSETSFEYIAPFTVRVTDKNGIAKIEKSRPFAGFGSEQVVEITHPSAGDVPSSETKLSIKYNSNGTLDTVSGHGLEQYYNYNNEGFLESYFSKEAGSTAYRYDNNGNIIWEKKNTDTPVELKYDNLGRLTDKVFTQPELNTKITYHDIDRKRTVEKNHFKWSYVENKDGLVKEAQLIHYSKQPIPSSVKSYSAYSGLFQRSGSTGGGRSGPIGGTGEWITNAGSKSTYKYGKIITDTGELIWNFSYDYSPEGALSRIDYPDGEVVSYAPNRIGQPTQAGDYVSTVRYWPNGALRSMTYQNGLTSTYSQSAANGQIQRIQHGSLWDKSYQFTAGSYVSVISDNLNAAKSISMKFDQLYQLKRVLNNSGNVIESFEYSPVGDLERKVVGSDEILYTYSSTTNRLASVKKNGQTKLLGYTPDGRVMTYGAQGFGYSDDKLMVEYDDESGDTWNYFYDGNNNKLLTLKNGIAYHYTLYDHNSQLIHEDYPSTNKTANLIYLDNRLVAKRDSKYIVDYAECPKSPVVNRAQGKTYLYHYPVYLHKVPETIALKDKGTLESGSDYTAPIAIAFPEACETTNPYGSWDHYIDTNSGIWSYNSRNEFRDKIVDVRHKASSSDRGDTGINHRYYRDIKMKDGNVYHKYSKDGTWRRYKCTQKYKVVRYTYSTLNSTTATGETVISRGEYLSGGAKNWRAWQKKPKYFCSNPALNPSKVPWPSE